VWRPGHDIYIVNQPYCLESIA